MIQRQVAAVLSPVQDIRSLVAALTPILRDHGFMINEVIKETTAYAPTNVTPVRVFDADTANVAQLSDVVGTLIADLKAKGILT